MVSVNCWVRLRPLPHFCHLILCLLVPQGLLDSGRCREASERLGEIPAQCALLLGQAGEGPLCPSLVTECGAGIQAAVDRQTATLWPVLIEP